MLERVDFSQGLALLLFVLSQQNKTLLTSHCLMFFLILQTYEIHKSGSYSVIKDPSGGNFLSHGGGVNGASSG